MAQRLFLLLLITGLAPLVPSIRRKYFLIPQPKSWPDAQLHCDTEYRGLPIARHDQDMTELKSEIQNLQFTSSAWIGLYLNTATWRWSMGEEPLGTFHPWFSYDPNNFGGNQACGSIHYSHFGDNDCSAPNLFVCFDGNYTGDQRYVLITTPMTWYDAQAHCRQHHTDLASSRDDAEHAVIAGLTSSLVWIGLYRETWKWTDRTDFSGGFLSWMSGQPNNARLFENCGAFNASTGGASDSLCKNLMPYFCYRDVMKQVVRVKVRSSDDVNGLTVKAAILEQVKQNVNRNIRIMGNVRTDWIEQPDGAVFHRVEANTTTGLNEVCEIITF